LNQKSTFQKEKPKFFAFANIRHYESQRFLTIQGETPVLGDHIMRDTNSWKIWKRQGNAFSFQNGVSDKYVLASKRKRATWSFEHPVGGHHMDEIRSFEVCKMKCRFLGAVQNRPK